MILKAESLTFLLIDFAKLSTTSVFNCLIDSLSLMALHEEWCSQYKILMLVFLYSANISIF